MSIPKPVVLCILDGWGHSDTPEHNAIAAAHTPNWDALLARYPHGLLNASEGFVGLPSGQMGNSEVGHMNIGAGRVVLQDLPRIDDALARKAVAPLPAFQECIAALKASGGACHLMGLASDGGVHAHLDHIVQLALLVAREGVPVKLHAFLDGRDTPPRSAEGYLAQLEAAIAQEPLIRLVSLCGRYYAMDRDKRWERIERAWRLIMMAQAPVFDSARQALMAAYRDDNSDDEFITPRCIGAYEGFKDGDGFLMANFRADRARQLLHALLDPAFEGFTRPHSPRIAAALGMVVYSDALQPLLPALFPSENLSGSIGEVVAQHGKRQLRIAETEKYAHVTFFFSGGREDAFEGEERILVPSPKVATYDLQPEMSAHLVTDALTAAIASQRHDLIVVNYANADMVGHSGRFDAAVKAVEVLDVCLGRLHEALQQVGGAMLITADHGNIEAMHDAQSGQPHTAHTLNLVPLVLVHPAYAEKPQALAQGKLADIAPTLLAMLHLPQSAAMTGKILLPESEAAHAC